MRLAPVPAKPTLSDKPQPFPAKGWNARHVMRGFAPGHAQRLANWMVRPDGLHIRPGHAVTLRGPAAPVTLMEFPTRRLAATASGLYDVTGETAAVLAGEFSDGHWSSAIIANAGGTWLAMANGVDGLRLYNGSTITAPAVTTHDPLCPLDPAKIDTLTVHHHRIFFSVRGTTDLWFLSLHAIAGPAMAIPLAPLLRKGGSVVAIASMTSDHGRNANDQLVAITSAGELVIYSGGDPEHAASWQLVGVFDVGRPVGRRCFVTFGGALLVATVGGLVPVPKALPAPASQRQQADVSYLIEPAWTAATNAEASDRWSLVESTSQEAVIAQIPGKGQFIYATETKAWSEANWPATCWLETDDGLFFGRPDGAICRVEGAADENEPIRAVMIDGYTSLGVAGRKTFQRVRPHFRMPFPSRPRIELLTDWETPPASFTNRFVAQRYWAWGELDWPMLPVHWERPDTSRTMDWTGAAGYGDAMAIALAVTARAPVVYSGADVAFTRGGGI